MGSFYLVAYWIHTFICSVCIPDSPPALSVLIPLTATAISTPTGGSSGITTDCTSIVIRFHSGGLCM